MTGASISPRFNSGCIPAPVERAGWPLALPACFVVFDLLARDGVDLRTRPYRRRRRALEKLLAPPPAGPGWC